MAASAGERLDLYLVRLGFAASRRDARELIERGAVRINGRRSPKGAVVASADHVEVLDQRRPKAILPNSELPLEVLYEDGALVVVNKPGAIPCHPLKPEELATVMNAVVARYPETAIIGDKPLEGGLVHRLDNGTSGALIVARTAQAHQALRRALRRGDVARKYEALVAGKMAASLDLNEPIGHHRRSAKRMAIAGGAAGPRLKGRPAATHVEPLRAIGAFTLVRVEPRTGSRHQIRVHLANAGHPIVGDALYGGPQTGALAPGRFWLHLAELGFESPASGRTEVRAPLPVDLQSLLD